MTRRKFGSRTKNKKEAPWKQGAVIYEHAEKTSLYIFLLHSPRL